MHSTGKRALLIGIDSYPRLERAKQLRGAVNDVREMARYLEDALGFDEEGMRVLIDAEATRANLLAALDRLVEETAEDDQVVVHFSGHGSRMAVREGRAGEAYEETLVPHDSGRKPSDNRDITSLELRERFVPLSEKTRRLTLVFDCCHSGTLSRDPFSARARFIPPAEGSPPRRHRPVEAGPAFVPYNRRYTLVAACRRNQNAYEIRLGGPDVLYQGALTHHLLTELREAAPQATWRDVMEAVEIAVSRRFRDQHPQLEGAIDRELFGIVARRPMSYLRVIQVDEEQRRITLDGGGVQGVGLRSRWAAYPPGTAKTDDSTRLAEIEIRSVQATSAEGELVDGETSCPPLGARLVETRLGELATRFRVEAMSQVGDRWIHRLAEEVKDHPLLEWCEPGTGADARVYLLESRDTVSDGDPAPYLGPILTPRYAVVGLDGDLLMPARELSGTEATITLVQNLAARARWLQVLELNPPNEWNLAEAVSFDILRRTNGTWKAVLPADGTFLDGERFAVRLQNRFQRPLFLYLLSLSCEGEIFLVYPAEGTWAPVGTGHPVSYGLDDGDGDSFSLSSDFPYADPGGPAEATEVLKLFVLEEETDFRPLFQDRYRQVRGWRDLYQRSLFGQRLCRLMTGDRDMRRVEGGVQRPWTTIERRVLIQRTGERESE